MIVAMLILYYTDKNNPKRLTYTSLIGLFFGLVMSAVFVGGPIYQSYKKSNAIKHSTISEIQEIKEDDLRDNILGEE
jgi:hypothetical protein